MNLTKISALFDGWEETLIWSALQGVMGEIAADCPDTPRSARVRIGDFCFFAGEPCGALISSLFSGMPPECESLIAVPQDEKWAALIEGLFPNARRATRYAFHKDPEAFDRQKLEQFARQVPAGYCLLPIGEALFHALQREKWSRDFCGNFPDYPFYRQYGAGFAALYEGEPVAGASAYTAYREGIEIQIETREDHRRKGLALCCGAALILRCLDRGLYPSWDAANRESLALAQKLGYRFDREYDVWDVTRDAF